MSALSRQWLAVFKNHKGLTLVIADFSVSFFVQIKNRARLVFAHQCNPVSLFSNLGQNAKHYLANWFKTFFQPSSFQPKSTSTKSLWHKRISVFGKIFVVFRQLGGANKR